MNYYDYYDILLLRNLHKTYWFKSKRFHMMTERPGLWAKAAIHWTLKDIPIGIHELQRHRHDDNPGSRGPGQTDGKIG
jgi:hypothetical protein